MNFSIILFLSVMICLRAGTSNARIQLQVPPTTIYAGEATTVNCTGTKRDFQYAFMPAMSLTSRGDCVIQDSGGYEPKRFKNYYQKSFIVTCKKGRHTIECKTNSNAMHQNAAVQLEVSERPPKIINQPRNITTNVGLPVTLTCYVEGDPNHYWVGWMSRHTIIQGGEEHSISTSPNFKSTNGTIHHLTIHSVKETGKYECKVYTIAGDVQDQVTHHISVTDHDDDQSEPFSLWNILRRLFL